MDVGDVIKSLCTSDSGIQHRELSCTGKQLWLGSRRQHGCIAWLAAAASH